MPRQKTQPGSEKVEKPPVSLPDDDGFDREDQEPLLAEEPAPDDPWAALWGEEGERENATVQLMRLSPESMIDPESGQTVQLRGYVDDLPPNLDSYEAYILARFGGGRYQAIKRIKGRFAKKLTVEIAGAPKTPTSIQRGGAPAAPVLNAPLPSGEIHEGIPIGGSDADFEKRLERMKIIDRMFPPPPAPADLNASLLQLVISQQGGGGVSNLKEMAETIVLLKEIGGSEAAPGAGGGDDWIGLIRSGVEAFREIVRNQRPSGISPGRRVVPVRPTPRLLPDNTQAATEAKPQEIEESATMTEPTVQQMVGIAIGVMTQSFLLDPRLTPEDTAQAIADTLPLSDAVRPGLKPFKQRILSQARIALSPEFLDNPQLGADFPVFFGQVFDLFTDPGWKPEPPIG